ncbi:hypothetical protein NJC38_05655 [Pseudomonas sp. 21LCFQ010]|nr:RHS repeat-associated core domain-containing protein [Pseudomonas sp. 21LCFQ010]MCO8161638.1 hypothetical protein [Pseudomonas sp. 21LCFQ010]
MRIYRYDPLDRLARTRSLAAAEHSSPGFNGELPDPLTGHYLLGHGYRADNPVLMRFNSPDSLSPFAEGGINAYAYCQGDPVNLQDPSGHIGRIAQWHLGVRLKQAAKIKKPTKAAASQSFGMGDLDAFEGTPHVMDRVLAQLSGDDLVAFSLASTRAKIAVDSVAKPLSIAVSADELSRDMILKMRDISLGQAHGYLPREVRRWSNLKSMAAHAPRSDIPMQEMQAAAEYISASNARTHRWQLSQHGHRS